MHRQLPPVITSFQRLGRRPLVSIHICSQAVYTGVPESGWGWNLYEVGSGRLAEENDAQRGCMGSWKGGEETEDLKINLVEAGGGDAVVTQKAGK